MSLLDFTQHPLWVNALVFLGSALVVWFAGTRLSGYANQISERTGVGKAFVGLLLLGGITSLPELAVTVSAALTDNAALAVNNLLGGVAMQVAILAAADAFLGRSPLSSAVPKPVVLLQATFDVLLLVLVIAAITLGESPLGFGLLGAGGGRPGTWSTLVLVGGMVAIWLVHRYEQDPAWVPDRGGPAPRTGRSGKERRERDEDADPMETLSLGAIVLRTVLAGVGILAAGFLLSRTGDAIAQQTGLGSSFVGAVFVAISTSLPEVSTVLAAVRLRQYELAVSDIFGTNLFDIALLFVVDLAYPGGPVLGQVGTFSVVAALLGIALTTIYLAGLIERRNLTIARMGWDSLLVLLTYLGGLVLLYHLR